MWSDLMVTFHTPSRLLCLLNWLLQKPVLVARPRSSRPPASMASPSPAPLAPSLEPPAVPCISGVHSLSPHTPSLVLKYVHSQCLPHAHILPYLSDKRSPSKGLGLNTLPSVSPPQPALPQYDCHGRRALLSRSYWLPFSLHSSGSIHSILGRADGRAVVRPDGETVEAATCPPSLPCTWHY